jgi:hypothetical protein
MRGAMKYVHILRSLNGVDRYHVGLTDELRAA